MNTSTPLIRALSVLVGPDNCNFRKLKVRSPKEEKPMTLQKAILGWLWTAKCLRGAISLSLRGKAQAARDPR